MVYNAMCERAKLNTYEFIKYQLIRKIILNCENEKLIAKINCENIFLNFFICKFYTFECGRMCSNKVRFFYNALLYKFLDI